MSDYWKKFYDSYTKAVPSEEPFRQVGRTLNKQPMSESMFQNIATHFMEMLELKPIHQVLDICCGNGLFSAEMAQRCKSVVGVDFSEKLVWDISLRSQKNIFGVVGDATEIGFRPKSFDRILFAAAIQHFSQAQVIRLMINICSWLKPGGILLITEILDDQGIWKFYNNREREELYFQKTMESTPILGVWFNRLWLEKLAIHAGFQKAQALDQPEWYWYSHYRFDLLCHK